MRLFWCCVLIMYRFNRECSAEKISNSNVNLSSSAELMGEACTATNFNQLNAERNFFQLSFDDQRTLLDYDIEFQGIRIPLKYVFAPDAKSLEFLRIADVLSHEMKLGVDLKVDASDCYNEKRFLQNETVRFYRSRYDEVGLDTIIADARINKGIYLSDIPEEDIPNFSEVVAQQIKKKLPWYWIVPLNVQSVPDIAEKSVSREAVSAYVSKNVLNLTNFEEKAFHDIFNSNRVIFLVNISPELNPEYTRKELNSLNAIKRISGNQLWIFSTVRKFDIVTLLSMNVYRQLPIEDEDFYWVPPRNHWSDKIDRLRAKDRNEWRFKLMAWANVTIENSTNCGNDADHLVDKTLYETFKHYTDIIISSIESETLTTANIESIYQHRALQTIFPNYYQGHLVESWFPNLSIVDFSTLNFDRSFIYRDQIHPVTAEFFVVDFFRQRLFASDNNVPDSIPNTLKTILVAWDQYDKVRVLQEGVYAFMFSETQTESLNRAIKHFKKFYTTAEQHGILIHAIYKGDMNMVKMLAKTFENNPKDLCELFNSNTDGPVNLAAELQSVDIMERLLKLLRDRLDVDCFKSLFCQMGMHQRNSIFLSAKRIDNFDFLLNHPVVPLTNKEKANLLIALDAEGDSILSYLIKSRQTKSFSNVFKAMGQMLDKEHAIELLNNQTFLHRRFSIDFELLSPEVFDVLLHWSEDYALKNETKNIFVMEDLQYQCSSLLRDGNIFVVQGLWTLFEAVYGSSSERKVFLDHHAVMLHSAMRNKDRKVFSFVREKFDLMFGPQKSKALIWELMSNSIYRHAYRELEEIDFHWPFFEELYRNREERRVKLKEKDKSHRTLLYRAREVTSSKYSFIWDRYNELLDQDEMERAVIRESDLPWYQRLSIYLGFYS